MIPHALVAKWKHWFQVDPIVEAQDYLHRCRNYNRVAWSMWSLGIIILVVSFFLTHEHNSRNLWKHMAWIEGAFFVVSYLCLVARALQRIKRSVIVTGQKPKRATTYEGDTYLFLHIVRCLESNLRLLYGSRCKLIGTTELGVIVEATLADYGARIHEEKNLVGQVQTRYNRPSSSWKHLQNTIAVFEVTHRALHQLRLAEKNNAMDYVAENH